MFKCLHLNEAEVDEMMETKDVKPFPVVVNQNMLKMRDLTLKRTSHDFQGLIKKKKQVDPKMLSLMTARSSSHTLQGVGMINSR